MTSRLSEVPAAPFLIFPRGTSGIARTESPEAVRREKRKRSTIPVASTNTLSQLYAYSPPAHTPRTTPPRALLDCFWPRVGRTARPADFPHSQTSLTNVPRRKDYKEAPRLRHTAERQAPALSPPPRHAPGPAPTPHQDTGAFAEFSHPGIRSERRLPRGIPRPASPCQGDLRLSLPLLWPWGTRKARPAFGCPRLALCLLCVQPGGDPWLDFSSRPSRSDPVNWWKLEWEAAEAPQHPPKTAAWGCVDERRHAPGCRCSASGSVAGGLAWRSSCRSSPSLLGTPSGKIRAFSPAECQRTDESHLPLAADVVPSHWQQTKSSRPKVWCRFPYKPSLRKGV